MISAGIGGCGNFLNVNLSCMKRNSMGINTYVFCNFFPSDFLSLGYLLFQFERLFAHQMRSPWTCLKNPFSDDFLST